MYHKVTLVGRLGKEPDAKMTPTGKFVCHCSVATNHQYKGADGNLVKETIWWNVSVWGNMGEAVTKYLHKGSKVLIEGRLNASKDGNPRVWQDNQGTWHGSFDLVASEVRFLDSKSGDSSGDEPVEESVPVDSSPPDVEF